MTRIESSDIQTGVCYQGRSVVTWTFSSEFLIDDLILLKFIPRVLFKLFQYSVDANGYYKQLQCSAVHSAFDIDLSLIITLSDYEPN